MFASKQRKIEAYRIVVLINQIVPFPIRLPALILVNQCDLTIRAHIALLKVHRIETCLVEEVVAVYEILTNSVPRLALKLPRIGRVSNHVEYAGYAPNRLDTRLRQARVVVHECSHVF